MTRTILLVCQTPPHRLVALVPVGRPVVIGRRCGCDLVIGHPSVSRRHAELETDGTVLRVADLGSTNGTFADEVTVTSAAVPVGSSLRFGQVAFTTSTEDVAGEPPAEHATPLLKDRMTETPARAHLSKAQRRVCDMLLEGLSEKRIASRLGLSRCTVHNHIGAIYRAFRVHSRAELLAVEFQRRT